MPSLSPETTFEGGIVEAEDRYSRQSMMDWWDQGRVSQSRVLVAGAGAIGNEVIKLLALMGVHNLIVVDFDKIEITNLTRSILFRESDVGMSKSIVAASRAKDINPESNAVGIDGDLEFDIGLGIYRSVDVVIGCLDSINARLAVNRACQIVGTPWLNGGIEDVFGEVALHSGSGACFECSMTEMMWLRRNMRFSCGGQRLDTRSERAPTTATISSVIAGYLVNEALMIVHSDDAESKQGLQAGQKLIVSMRPYDFQIVEMTRNPGCTAHERWAPVDVVAAGPDEITPYELLKLSDSFDNKDNVVEIGFDLLTEMTCVNCGLSQQILQPIEKSHSSLTVCPCCGNNTRKPITVSWIDADSPLAALPMSALCIPQHQIVAIHGVNGRRYIQLGGDQLNTAASKLENTNNRTERQTGTIDNVRE